MKFGITGKKDSAEVYEIARRLCEWLGERGIEFFVEQNLGRNIEAENLLAEPDLAEAVDIIVVFGGDGSFIWVSRIAQGQDVSILGCNLGGLGFLTEFTVDEFFPMMEKVVAGDYEIERRDMISCSVVRKDGEQEEFTVLNDIVINNGPISKVVDLSIYIEERYVTTFKADGIIFATPTGSTAYSLSAGGPIIYPTLPVITVTPICPHILTNRPIVVPNTKKIRTKVLTDIQNTYLTLDGQVGVPLSLGDEVILEGSESFVNIIKSPFRDYFNILKTKLMWSGRYENSE
ncbi:MAG: NAD(+)/NADH kinase [Candidatus Dadabacteria bacterium]|nr:NAD(+)/NADH kinase [Candidatus Dadabacteria bacterium]MYC40652.1 NAD(+)/NADH kinase [Candidatus Dadabacteria bacterium]